MADLKAFGRELIRGNFGNAIKSLSTQVETVEPYAYRGGKFFFGVGGSESLFSYSGVESSLKAYTQCPELQSIINRRAVAHNNGNRWIMRKGGKGKGKEDSSEYAVKCRKLLQKPNPFQSGQQFETQLKIYLDVFGWCMILPIYAYPQLGKRGLSEATAIFLIPPYMLEYQETFVWKQQKSLKDVLQYVNLTVGGIVTALNLEQVVIIKDVVPRMYTGTIDGTGGMAELLLFPESKVRAQEKPINNIISAYESRGELIRYAGSQGIVSPEQGTGGMIAMPLTPEEQDDLQNKFKLQYGIGTKQYRYIISQSPLKFSPMGRPTRDLMLFEEIDADVRALCNAWYYPWKLLADSGSSLNGTEVNALTRNLYQDAIIPEATAIEEQLAEAFKAEENGTVWQIDYSHVAAMQEDEKLKAETRQAMGTACFNDFKNGFITYNRALELMGEDMTADGDIYYHEWTKIHLQTIPNEQSNGNQSGTESNGNQTETESESD